MVINNFDIFRASLGPAEANPELFVDSNAVLTLAVAMQWLQHISGRYTQIIQLACSLELPNFPQGNSLKVDEARDTASACQFLGILTLERYDHGSMMTGRVINVKRYDLTDGSGERHNAKLCGNFAAEKRWKNGPATAAGYALFVVAPEPENFHHSLFIQHLVDQTMLNIDAA